MNIGAYLKEKRKRLGLTQKEVADACNVSVSSVSLWEKGITKNMRRDRLSQLAKVLEIDPITLIQWVDADEDPEVTAQLNRLSFKDRILIAKLEQLMKVFPDSPEVSLLKLSITTLYDNLTRKAEHE